VFFFQVGLLDLELNQLTKALFVALVALSVVMVTLQGFVGPWYRNLFRFLLLFSYIIPISLRVNLDMGKAAYGWMIMKDESIPGTVVRTSTIPEGLGRLVYLLTDKTAQGSNPQPRDQASHTPPTEPAGRPSGIWLWSGLVIVAHRGLSRQMMLVSPKNSKVTRGSDSRR